MHHTARSADEQHLSLYVWKYSRGFPPKHRTRGKSEDHPKLTRIEYALAFSYLSNIHSLPRISNPPAEEPGRRTKKESRSTQIPPRFPHPFPSINHPFSYVHQYSKKTHNTVSLSRLLLLLEPVPGRSLLLAGAGGSRLGALDLDRHVLVLLERGREVGLLGGGGGLGGREDLDVGVGVAGLDGGGLVGLELLEVELLDEVGCSGGNRSLATGGLTGVPRLGGIACWIGGWNGELGMDSPLRATVGATNMRVCVALTPLAIFDRADLAPYITIDVSSHSPQTIMSQHAIDFLRSPPIRLPPASSRRRPIGASPSPSIRTGTPPQKTNWPHPPSPAVSGRWERNTYAGTC